MARDPAGVARLVASIARNVATTASFSKLAADAAGDRPLNRTTATEYLRSLERLFIVEDAPCWRSHLRSRSTLHSSPKRHFVDPSLAVSALGASPQRLLADLEALGFLFESLAVRDLRIYGQAAGASVWHYRDSDKLEVAPRLLPLPPASRPWSAPLRNQRRTRRPSRTSAAMPTVSSLVTASIVPWSVAVAQPRVPSSKRTSPTTAGHVCT